MTTAVAVDKAKEESNSSPDTKRTPSPQPSTERQINWWKILLLPSVVEFTATLIFVFVVTLSNLTTGDRSSNAPIINAAFGSGLIVMVLIYAVGPISGCHINPAVTLGAFCSGLVAPGIVLAYIVAQLTGSVVGAALTRAVVSNESVLAASRTYWPLGMYASSISPAQALGLELLLTFILMLVILMTDVDHQSVMTPLAIGFVVVAEILAGGDKSGASMNPARSFGPAIAFGVHEHLYVYFVGPVVGAVLASLFHRFVLTKKKLPVPLLSSSVQLKTDR